MDFCADLKLTAGVIRPRNEKRGARRDGQQQAPTQRSSMSGDKHFDELLLEQIPEQPAQRDESQRSDDRQAQQAQPVADPVVEGKQYQREEHQRIEPTRQAEAEQNSTPRLRLWPSPSPQQAAKASVGQRIKRSRPAVGAAQAVGRQKKGPAGAGTLAGP